MCYFYEYGILHMLFNLGAIASAAPTARIGMFILNVKWLYSYLFYHNRIL